MNFTGKTVLVTGAGRGMGEAIAKGFHMAGANVAALDLSAPLWESTGSGKLLPLAADISDERQVISAFAAAEQSLGVIDILINNAGIYSEAPVQETTMDQWNSVMGVNATGTFLCIREMTKRLLPAGKSGSIVNIASIAGKNAPFPNCIPYVASKAAIVGMTRMLAVELGAHDITVNAICPGSVATEMIMNVVKLNAKNANVSEDEMRKRMTATIPVGRFQQPQDVADLAMFLASEHARNISGEAINLDGGVVRD
jgi:NAD(P)-dependent dehydrogenase (short-subunit alcohol dehydrogenase family)